MRIYIVKAYSKDKTYVRGVDVTSIEIAEEYKTEFEKSADVAYVEIVTKLV
jgi:hypothetical protein